MLDGKYLLFIMHSNVYEANNIRILVHRKPIPILNVNTVTEVPNLNMGTEETIPNLGTEETNPNLGTEETNTNQT